MKIIINNKVFEAVKIFTGEFAFSISDAVSVLDCYDALSVTVLGGDILTDRLIHNYDSWYYNYDDTLSETENSKNSKAIAKAYLKNYIDKNGTAFYCVIVTKQKGWYRTIP